MGKECFPAGKKEKLSHVPAQPFLLGEGSHTKPDWYSLKEINELSSPICQNEILRMALKSLVGWVCRENHLSPTLSFAYPFYFILPFGPASRLDLFQCCFPLMLVLFSPKVTT